MFQNLVSHNNDIKRLVDIGYAVAFDSGYLIIRDIPYLNPDGELAHGAIVTKLVFIDKTHVTQDDHQIFFAGTAPFGLDSKPIPNLADRAAKLTLSGHSRDIVVERRFSNKPKMAGKYTDFYEKVESYVAIISGPAMMRFDCTPYTFRTVETLPDSVFKFHDTLTSRAEIGDLSAALNNDIIALIGLGGTGAYILDFLVKTPVKEIRAFDQDGYYVHNAYRSPGGTVEAEFGKAKTAVYKARYSRFRHGLSFNNTNIDSSSSSFLEGVSFAFVCVDTGPSRSDVFDVLIARSIPFIDVGMGLSRNKNALNGMLRTTYYPANHASGIRTMRLAEEGDGNNDLYRTNIQIAELNALNACLAIIKYKKIREFYADESDQYNLLYEINDNMIVGETLSNEV